MKIKLIHPYLKFPFYIILIFTFLKCKNEDDTTPFLNANGKRGGILYDTFWATEGNFNQKDTAKLKKIRAFSEFYKCSHCHGWDLEANKGAFIDRAATKTRPNVSPNNLRELIKNSEPDGLFTLIKKGVNPGIRRPFTDDLSAYDPITNRVVGDRMPNYAELLSDAQIWDIVKFFKTEALDVSEIYNQETSGFYPVGKITFSDIGKSGVAARGKNLYITKGCAAANCHGPNGTTLLLDNKTSTLGGFITAKPYEAQHKVKFGQLGTTMRGVNLTLDDMKDIFKAIATDSVAFPLRK
jgi:mono/diheme cytochrome c family protein